MQYVVYAGIHVDNDKKSSMAAHDWAFPTFSRPVPVQEEEMVFEPPKGSLHGFYQTITSLINVLEKIG